MENRSMWVSGCHYSLTNLIQPIRHHITTDCRLPMKSHYYVKWQNDIHPPNLNNDTISIKEILSTKHNESSYKERASGCFPKALGEDRQRTSIALGTFSLLSCKKLIKNSVDLSNAFAVSFFMSADCTHQRDCPRQPKEQWLPLDWYIGSLQIRWTIQYFLLSMVLF